jgi:hypothetical protein
MELKIDPDLMRPIIAEVVKEVWKAIEDENQKFTEKLGYSEAEAAALLNVHQHVLRDERMRRRIRASKIVGGRIRYLRSDLMEYMIEREWGLGKEPVEREKVSTRDQPQPKPRKPK